MKNLGYAEKGNTKIKQTTTSIRFRLIKNIEDFEILILNKDVAFGTIKLYVPNIKI